MYAVIPEKAGIQGFSGTLQAGAEIQGSSHASQAEDWTPAFAGVTVACTPPAPEADD